MITLITGTPGSGKTAWTVQEITRLPSQRKVYVHGIPDLKIAHEPVYCRSELCDLCRSYTEDQVSKNPLFVEDWPDWATDGSLIIVDEVQRIWRPTNGASALPDGISRLETHRHNGLDFWLISQGPHLFHSNIRLLIGRHIHLVANWMGRTEYEFPECRQNVTSRSDAVIRPYKLPKKIFHLYTSASLHTKQDKRKPLSLYVLIICLIGILFVGYRIYNRFNSINAPVAETSKNAAPVTGSVERPGTGAAITDVKKHGYPDFKPVIKNVPLSAPAYAELVQVKQAPHIIGCVRTPDFCRCYSKQAVPLDVSPQFCTEYLAGHYFNPFKSVKENHDSQIMAQNTIVDKK